MLDCSSKSNDYNGRIDELLSAYQIEKFYSKLEWYFSDYKCYTSDRTSDQASNNASDRPDDAQAKDELHRALNSLKSLTAKEEFLRRIK